MAKLIHKKDILDFVMMLVGCCFYALALNLFLSPHVIVAGGVSGIGVIVHALYEQFNVGILIIIVNVPILLLSIRPFGWKFVVKSLITIVVLGVVTDVFALFLPSITDNTLLAALYGGVCQGIGVGLFVRSNYSSGGTETVARIIVRYVKVIKITTCLPVLDGIIVIAGAIATKSPINLLYALIVIFTANKLIDLIVTGFDKSKLCIIVSDNGEAISKALLEKSPRGVTMWNGKGMYTSTEHNVLLTCVKNRQLEQLKSIVKSVDNKAFIMVQDSVEVRGKGFSSLEDDLPPRPIGFRRKKKKDAEQPEKVEENAPVEQIVETPADTPENTAAESVTEEIVSQDNAAEEAAQSATEVSSADE
ncbi:MAG: YitT family protein [Clostridiales bacterium]|nr:YitT family protein [Clostridiales bacterium]